MKDFAPFAVIRTPNPDNSLSKMMRFPFERGVRVHDEGGVLSKREPAASISGADISGRSSGT
ncbi:hypothetical protein ACCT19_33870 [Rhizobium ruizarguesonis]